METLCAIYARFSSQNQREASIEDQVRLCKEFASRNLWVVSEEDIYVDKAVSARGTTGRNGFNRMLKAATNKTRRFSKILVHDTSRVARNTKEALDVFGILGFYGVHVVYVTQGIDTSAESAEEMITLHGLIDSMYIRNLAKNTHRGIEGQLLKGFSAGGRRYGYRSIPVYTDKVDIYGNPVADGYRHEINPLEAETVIRIFRMFGEDGLSAKMIVNTLNDEYKRLGTPKPPRGEHWQVSTILGSRKDQRGILNNEFYIGNYYWNRSSVRIKPGMGSKHRVSKEKSAWMLLNKPELAIIPKDLWDKGQGRRKEVGEKSAAGFNKTKSIYSRHLLSGILKCPKCGGNMAIVSGGKNAKYGCTSNWNMGDSVCDNNVKIDKTKIEFEVLDKLDIEISQKDERYISRRVKTLLKEALRDERADWKLDALRKELVRTVREITNLTNAIKSGLITDTVKASLLASESQKSRLESEIDDLVENGNESPPKINAELLNGYLRGVGGLLRAHPTIGREIISIVLPRASSVLGAECDALIK